jgi:L-asparaginase II
MVGETVLPFYKHHDGISVNPRGLIFSMINSSVLVEIRRGDVVESVHGGMIAVSDAAGRPIAGWGQTGQPVFPRSAIKPLQALPLIETGAADRFGLTTKHIALACASHGGEDVHVTEVAAWLRGIDLDDRALECGAHWPSDPEASHRLAREGGAPCPLHNNCSGKHSGFLTTALALGEDVAGYIAYDHPVQRRVAQTLGEMMDLEMAAQPWGVDGCGIPTFAVPLSAIATGMARLADPSRLGARRVAACARIRAAMRHHPFLVAGTDRPCTAIMTVVPDIVVKAGAEGVYTAALPRQGLGVALKIADGAGRAAEVALVGVLDRLGVLDDGARRVLRERALVRNVVGTVVGEMRPASGWLRE